MSNNDLSIVINATIDRTIVAFVATLCSKYKLKNADVMKLWEETTVTTSASSKKVTVNLDSDDESEMPSRPVKKTLDSDDDSVPTKKTLDNDDDSDLPKKKTVNSDDDSESPVKNKKKAVDSDDDSLPPAKGKKTAPAKKASKVVYEESDTPANKVNVPDGCKIKFLKGYNYIVHKGKVVGGFGKNGITPLMAAHIKALESDAYSDITFEKYDKEKLNKLFNADKYNKEIRADKPPVKRQGKKK